MKILVLGGAGYLADGIVDCLVRDGHAVTVYDNLLYQDYFLKEVEFIHGDIRDREKLSVLMPKYDTIVLLAGIVGDHACQVFPDKTAEINTDAPKWIFDNFHGKIFYMSTCSVFGKNDAVLNEDSDTLPLSLYASSKLEAEKHLLTTKPNALCLRLGTVYGRSGSHSRPRLDLVGNVLAAKAVLGKPLTVFGRQQSRPLINCLNVAEAVAFGLRNDISGMYVLSEDNYTLGEIAEKIAAMVPNAAVEYNDLNVEDMRNYKVDPSKFASHGWRPTFTFEDGIRSIFELVASGRIKDMDNPLYHNGKYLQKLSGI